MVGWFDLAPGKWTEDVAVFYVSLEYDPHANGQCSTSSWLKWRDSVLSVLLSFGQQGAQHLATYFVLLSPGQRF